MEELSFHRLQIESSHNVQVLPKFKLFYYFEYLKKRMCKKAQNFGSLKKHFTR